MPSVNKVIIIGNLGRDPEIRFTKGNDPVATISVATTESWKDKSSGEWQEKTEWHRVVAWRALAEKAEQKLKRGSLVYIEGRLETRKWQKDGEDRYSTEINASVLLPLVADQKPEPEAEKKSFTPPAAPAADGPDPDDDLPF